MQTHSIGKAIGPGSHLQYYHKLDIGWGVQQRGTITKAYLF